MWAIPLYLPRCQVFTVDVGLFTDTSVYVAGFHNIYLLRRMGQAAKPIRWIQTPFLYLILGNNGLNSYSFSLSISLSV